MHEKTIFLSKTTENVLQVIKTLDNSTGVNIKEGQSVGIEETF
jgi:hypothetical protein